MLLSPHSQGTGIGTSRYNQFFQERRLRHGKDIFVWIGDYREWRVIRPNFESLCMSKAD